MACHIDRSLSKRERGESNPSQEPFSLVLHGVLHSGMSSRLRESGCFELLREFPTRGLPVVALVFRDESWETLLVALPPCVSSFTERDDFVVECILGHVQSPKRWFWFREPYPEEGGKDSNLPDFPILPNNLKRS